MLSPNNVYCGHCLDIMNNLDNKSIDFIFTDLPFGIIAPKWDQKIDLNKLWGSYNRILKNNGTIALFSCQPFTTELINSNLKSFRYCWYWIKNQGTNFFHAKRMPIRLVEEINIFGKGKYNPQITDNHIPTNSAKGCSNGKTYHGINKRDYIGGKTTRYPTNVLNFKCVDNYSRLHSAQKPIDLCEYIIKTYTNENELVLDNCCGSGSICVAAKNLNRQFIGIDNDEESIKISKNRLGII